MTAETAVPDVTLNGFKPTRAAWEAFQAFRPRSAGGRPAETAAWAATVILYTELSEPVNALVRHYVHRQSVLVGSETPRHRPVQPWDEDHRARVLEAHRETLRCLMIVLLAPRHINPDVIAPGDFPGLAAIAVGNSRPTR